MTANPSPGIAARRSTPIPFVAEDAESRELLLNILFTSPERTLVALQRGTELAAPIGGKTRILVPHVVPYPLPLREPDVNPAVKLRSLQGIRLPSGAGLCIQVLLCRNPINALLQTLSPNSLVLAATRERRWPSGEMQIIKRLRSAGHEVLLFRD